MNGPCQQLLSRVEEEAGEMRDGSRCCRETKGKHNFPTIGSPSLTLKSKSTLRAEMPKTMKRSSKFVKEEE